MIINIEFLDDEPIENVMTALHFRIDKTIFFGYKACIEAKRKVTERFLKKYCSVQEIMFYEIPEGDLKEAIRIMKKVLLKEKENENQLFFDITGGENMILVAFGMLAEKLGAPMHMFDVMTRQMVELNEENDCGLLQVAEKQDVKLNLDGFIELYGGVINYRLQKNVKNIEDPRFAEEIEILWKVSSKYAERWNLFADVLRRCCLPEEDMRVDVTSRQVLAALRKSGRFRSVREFGRILKDCADAGILEEFFHTQERLSFRYKSEKIKELLWDAGSILEMHTFLEERKTADDCRVGVHLDWDGVIYHQSGKDTLNEVDVLSLHGVIPTFISCKNGSVNQMALYELQTVAEKFGGKYARKVIAAPQGLNDTHSLRAKEMGITVRS